MKLLLLTLLSFFCSFMEAQQPLQFRIGGAGAEAARAVAKTTDGGFVMAGSTNTFGQDSGDVYIVKMNNNGSLQWTRTIGGPSFDVASDIIQTSDGGYAITGRTGYWEFGIYVVKLDSAGGVQWSKRMNYGLFDQGHAIIQTADGGFAVAASGFEPFTTTYAGFLIKLSNTGALQWKTYHNVFSDGAYSLVQSSDLSFVIAGTSAAAGGNLLISKVNSNGIVAWCRNTGGPGSETAKPGARLIRTNDNGYAYIGSTDSYGAGNKDMYVIKLDNAGVLQWSKAIGTANNDYGNALLQVGDHGFIVGGTTYKTDNTTDAYVAKLDSSGNLLWTRILGGNAYEEGNTATQLNDGIIIIAGSTTSYGNGSEIYVVKMDGFGNTCGNYTTAGTGTSGGISNTVTYNSSTLNLSVVNGPAFSAAGGVMNAICNCIPPVSVITSSALTVCSGDSIQLVTNTSPGNAYQWLVNGSPVTGATNSTFYASTGGSYTCIQSNACGTDTSNSINVTTASLPAAKITSTGPTTFCSGGSVVLNAPVSNNKSYQWFRNNNPVAGATAASCNATLSGKYKVRVTNLLTGCSKTTSSGTLVTVNALPAATVTPLGPTTFCAGDSVVLQANSGSGLTYQWKKNGSNIAGVVAGFYTATTPGNYRVKTTNVYGCTNLSAITSVSVPCRTTDLSREDPYRIYPNPGSGIFIFELQDPNSEITQLKVFDALEREIFNKVVDGITFQIDLSPFEDGIYYVHICNSNSAVRREAIMKTSY